MFAQHIPGTAYQADRVAFTSDLHVGHDKPFIVQARGFASVGAHDAAIKAALLALKCDHLFLLGDVVVSGEHKADRVLALVEALPYPVTLVRGNHDPSALKLAVLDPVEAATYIQLDAKVVRLCHYPADFVDHRGRDFSDVLPPDDGGILLHGHTHRREKITISKHGTRQLHVGWDAWQRPVFGAELLVLVP